VPRPGGWRRRRQRPASGRTDGPPTPPARGGRAG
jgi:hypothetical protein